jgi:hypothetical protein
MDASLRRGGYLQDAQSEVERSSIRRSGGWPWISAPPLCAVTRFGFEQLTELPTGMLRVGLRRKSPQLFLHMAGDKLGHLKHADLLFAVEDGFEIFIRIDESSFLGILQAVLANVGPKLFRQLGPW